MFPSFMFTGRFWEYERQCGGNLKSTATPFEQIAMWSPDSSQVFWKVSKKIVKPSELDTHRGPEPQRR